VTAAGRDSIAGPRRSIRIATFNLESFGGETVDETATELRCAVLRPRLVRLDADILCLQEVNGQHVAGASGRRLAALDQLLRGTPYAGYRRAWTRGKSGDGAFDVHNLVVLSRYPIQEFRQIHNSLVPAIPYAPATVGNAAGSIAWDRPLLHAALELPGGRRLHVINLHLRAPLATFLPGQKQSSTAWKTISGWAEGFFISAIKRAGQALEVRLFIDELFAAEEGALIAVCGDFNAEAREMPVRIIRGDPQDCGNPALAGRSLAALESSGVESPSFSVIHGGRRLLLDHILVSKPLALACRALEIDNTALADETKGDGLPLGSFHAPLVASFELD
jgi:endonuclease/exonuclease/phosphatase family metal-dependent hydrolase